MKPIKYFFMMLTYLWLRYDLILYLTFRKDWMPRFEFLSSIFGELDSDKFLEHRIKLVKARSKKLPPVILPSQVNKKVNQFLKTSPGNRLDRDKRLEIIKTLLFWALDPEINQFNIDSYQTRYSIVEAFLNPLFQNALSSEVNEIFSGLRRIVFSRVTYLGAKGEPSPVVHDAIISSTARILTSHINEIIRLRNERLDKMTKIKLIKEIQKGKGGTGSLAFSGEARKHDEFKNKFPLPYFQAKLLWRVLNHYRFSAWPESRDKTERLIANMEEHLGFSIEELFVK